MCDGRPLLPNNQFDLPRRPHSANGTPDKCLMKFESSDNSRLDSTSHMIEGAKS